MAGTAGLPATARARSSGATRPTRARLAESPAAPAAVAGDAIDWRCVRRSPAPTAGPSSGKPLLASRPAAGDPRDLRLLPHRRRHRRPFLRRRFCRARSTPGSGSSPPRRIPLRSLAAARAQYGVPVAPARDLITGVGWILALPLCDVGRAQTLLLSRGGNGRSHGGADPRV